jgi:hypothetical protein
MLPVCNNKQGMLFHAHGEVGPQEPYFANKAFTVTDAGAKIIETRQWMGRAGLTGRCHFAVSRSKERYEVF